MAPETDPFAQAPPNAEGHFRLLFYSAVMRINRYLERLSELAGYGVESLPDLPFLQGYAAELRACLPAEIAADEQCAWWRDRLLSWEANVKARLPMRSLALALKLSDEEQAVLMLAGLVEEDIRFGSLFAALQEPLLARRPCLGLLGALTANESRGGALADAWPAARRLLDFGLVTVENQNAPRAEWILRAPALVWEAIRGRAPRRLNSACELFSRREFPPLKKIVLDERLRERLCRMPAVIARGQINALILRGMENSGRRTTMGSVAREMRRDLLFYDRRVKSGAAPEPDLWPVIGPFCALTGAFPVVAIDPAPGETIELPPLAGYNGPMGVVMRREGGVEGSSIERALTLELPAPSAAQRSFIWRRALGARAGDDIDEIADRLLLPLGASHRTAGVAAAYAALDRRKTVTRRDAQMAARALNRQALDTLAQRLETNGDWIDLVVNNATSSDLRDLERRCHHRERLIEHSGAAFAGSVNCGVRALFNGPSGTGKTLAAKILASALAMDLYRVDLASVVNKYIGETEKNLSRLLARAEELDVLLLIDEGDSLMSNRTDVKSANDRYANLETNYLLQRLESYQGIIIVTTNAGNRIDTAFHRRFDMVIEFSPPEAFERLLIWRRHLPEESRVNSEFLEDLAQQCALTGGQIRNAALHSALLAIDGGHGAEVSETDLETAVMREYRKAGATCPLYRPTFNRRRDALSQFLAEIG
jgi:ATPase family associated with various cellular activities (AAA)